MSAGVLALPELGKIYIVYGPVLLFKLQEVGSLDRLCRIVIHRLLPLFLTGLRTVHCSSCINFAL